jgi:CHAT domain-containing protein
LGSNEQALAAYRSARELFEAVGDQLGQGNTFKGEADVLFLLGSNEQALAAYRSARELFEAVGDQLGQGNTWRGEADVLLDQGDFHGALAAAEKAESFARATGAGVSTINAILVQARAFRRLDDQEKVVELSTTALDRFDQLRSGFLTDPQRTRFEGVLNRAFDLLIVALLELDRPSEALERAEQARSRVLLDLVATRFAAKNAEGTGDASFDLQQQYDQLHDELAQVQKDLAAAADDAARQTLLDRRRSLDRRLENLAFEILLSSKSRLETTAPLSIDEMQAVVEEVGPVLFFYVAAGDTLAALLRPGARPEIRRLELSWPELTDTSREFAEVLANPNYRDRYRERGRTLAKRILGPFQEQLAKLPEGGPLTVIPHGPLHQIPFEALVDSGDRLLLERFDVTVAPSLSTLKELRDLHRPPEDRDRFLALASGEGLTIPLGEIRTIAAFFDPEETADYDPTLTRFATYRRRAPLARHLLIATQGVHRPNSRRGTYLQIEPSDAHDGRLTAAEIAAIPLEAELVTLAACDTARGEPLLSDERLDLTRAFLTAGATAVLATRWKVPEDHHTSRFLVDFYRAYRHGGPDGEGLRKDQALSAARRLSIERGDPPQIWAAWVLVGDPR